MNDERLYMRLSHAQNRCCESGAPVLDTGRGEEDFISVWPDEGVLHILLWTLDDHGNPTTRYAGGFHPSWPHDPRVNGGVE